MKSIIVNDIFPFDHTDNVIYLVKFVSIKTVGGRGSTNSGVFYWSHYFAGPEVLVVSKC